jgi:hypothetical protein
VTTESGMSAAPNPRDQGEDGGDVGGLNRDVERLAVVGESLLAAY